MGEPMPPAGRGGMLPPIGLVGRGAGDGLPMPIDGAGAAGFGAAGCCAGLAVGVAVCVAGFAAAAGFRRAAGLRAAGLRAAGLRAAGFRAAGLRAVVLRVEVLRAVDLRAVLPRAAVFRAGAFLVVFLAVVLRAVVLRAVVLRAPVLRAVVFLAALARPPVRLLAVVFLVVVRFFPLLVAMVLLRFCCCMSPSHTGACTPNHALQVQACRPAQRVNCFFHYTLIARESVILAMILERTIAFSTDGLIAPRRARRRCG